MKKYYLFLMLLLFAQCDYKPIYSQNNQNFEIRIIEFNKNRSNKNLATRLKNYSYRKDNVILYELKLLTSENKLMLSKDTKGDPLLLGLKNNLKIEVNGELNPNRFLGSSNVERAGFKSIKLHLIPDTDADIETLTKWLQIVEDRCPVKDNLQNSTPISIAVEKEYNIS